MVDHWHFVVLQRRSEKKVKHWAKHNLQLPWFISQNDVENVTSFADVQDIIITRNLPNGAREMYLRQRYSQIITPPTSYIIIQYVSPESTTSKEKTSVENEDVVDTDFIIQHLP